MEAVIDKQSSSKCGIRPIGDRVVLRLIEVEAKTPGGILLPDQAKDKPQEGQVLAIGPELENRAIHHDTVSVGDHVLFPPYAGTDITHQGETLKVVKESDLLAIVAPTPVAEPVTG